MWVKKSWNAMGNDVTSFGQYRVSVISFATFANGYSTPCPDETGARSFRFGEDKFLDTHNNVGQTGIWSPKEKLVMV